MGFFTLLEERLKSPFKTEVLGVEVTVARLDMTDDEQIVALCSPGKSQQPVPILDLTLPDPPHRRCGVDRSVPPLGARQMMMARKPIQIDRDKLRAEVRKLGNEYVFFMLATPLSFCPRPSSTRSRRSTSI